MYLYLETARVRRVEAKLHSFAAALVVLSFVMLHCPSSIGQKNIRHQANAKQIAAPKEDAKAHHPLWVTAYYAGWMQRHLPPKEIDFSALTTLIHFALAVKPDGTLDDKSHNVTPASSADIVKAAHAAGKKILISIGGTKSAAHFRRALEEQKRDYFISNLIQLMSQRGYDGLDIDWEPLEKRDRSTYTAFIRDLRLALQKKHPHRLLTAAVSWQPEIIAEVQQLFDQINVMTYDYAQGHTSKSSWYNAPLFSQTCQAHGNDQEPSANHHLQTFITAGIPPKKLGLGIDFYGYVWRGGSGTPKGGATSACQTFEEPPRIIKNVPYFKIMARYFRRDYYRWDDISRTSFLSIDKAGGKNDMFISFDDGRTVMQKVSYAYHYRLGGVFIWELGGGYQSNLQSGKRDMLLQVLKKRLRSPIKQGIKP